MPERTIENKREPINDRGNPVNTGNNSTNRTSLLETRGNSSARGIAPYTDQNQSIPNWGNSVTGIKFSDVYAPIEQVTSQQSGASQTGAAYQPLYAIDNPFGIGADLFSRFYGGAPVDTPQSPVVVGDAAFATQGGSNLGLLVLLAVLVIVGYFLYKRYVK